MGRRRRKVVHIPKKRLPKFFSCPQCGKETVRVELRKEENWALVGCSSCGLQEEFEMKSVQDEVDFYCMFTDRIYGGSKRASTTDTKSI